jgi:hypothetical protein
MSTDHSNLQAWIDALVAGLADDPWGGAQRLREVVRGYTARITLDDETVVVSMPNDQLEWLPPGGDASVDGVGRTTTPVVLALLAGRLEVAQAVERGLLDAVGSPEAVVRIFHAVELLLDGAARVPALRRLADEFSDESGGWPALPDPPGPTRPDELALLERLGIGIQP